MTPKQQAEVIALSQYLEERLYPALLYVFWLDKNNHSQMTRPWFVKHMPFPFAMYYPVSFLIQFLLIKIEIF